LIFLPCDPARVDPAGRAACRPARSRPIAHNHKLQKNQDALLHPWVKITAASAATLRADVCRKCGNGHDLRRSENLRSRHCRGKTAERWTSPGILDSRTPRKLSLARRSQSRRSACAVLPQRERRAAGRLVSTAILFEHLQARARAARRPCLGGDGPFWRSGEKARGIPTALVGIYGAVSTLPGVLRSTGTPGSPQCRKRHLERGAGVGAQAGLVQGHLPVSYRSSVTSRGSTSTVTVL
jgi:hypothetical protein